MTSFDSATPDLLAEIVDGVAVLTLNRPDRRNAMSDGMVTELARLLGVAESAPEVGAVLLQGAGQAFSSGGDVKGFDERGGEGGGAQELDPGRVRRQVESQRGTVLRLVEMAKPSVAVLPGAAAGAGMGIALATDFRVGCPRTMMTTAFVKVGLAGDFGTAWLLNALVGPARATRYMMLGERIRAEELLSVGLLHSIVPEDEVREAGLTLARGLANGPRAALAGIRAGLLAARSTSLRDFMDDEVVRHMRTGLTADHVEAVRAFVEKREPKWS